MVYPVTKRILFPILKLWIKEINGMDNLLKEGPFIIASNHASYLDHYLLGLLIVPRLNVKLHFLAKKEHFGNPINATWHKYVGAISIDRQSGGKKALKTAIIALKKGKIMAIHPEGTRTLTGNLLRGKTGVARLLLAAEVPVIPVGLIGTFEILPKGKYIPKFMKATVNIGKPLYFKKYYKKNMTKETLRHITTIIMKEIAKLSRQEYNFR